MREIDRRLLDCAENGDLDGVVSALDADADINIQDKYGRTALMLAATFRYIETVNRLIQNDANINVQDKQGRTALMSATIYGNIEIVNRLIQAGADLFVKNEDGMTALNIAKEYGRIPMVQLFEQGILEYKKRKLERDVENVEHHNMSMWLY